MDNDIPDKNRYDDYTKKKQDGGVKCIKLLEKKNSTMSWN